MRTVVGLCIVGASLLAVAPACSSGEGASGGATTTGGTPAVGGSGGASAGGVNAGGTSDGGSNSGGTSDGGSNAGGTSDGGSNSGGTSAGGSNAGGTSAGGSNAGGTSDGGTGAGGSNAGGTSDGGTGAGGSNAGGTSAGGSNAGGTSAGGSNAGGTSAGGTGGGGGGTGGANGLDACGNAKGQLFPPGSAWNMPIDTAPLDAESSAIIAFLQSKHTATARFQIDFSIKILTADGSTPKKPFVQTGDFYSPDCDPAPPPVPPGGALEGETGYQCLSDGDCHLIVINKPECRLYEMWRANITSGGFFGGCNVVWDLKKVYPPNERGDYCTSADAAGLPIAAHMFSADEIQAGAIEHAIRFILPNNLIRKNLYVHHASHSTGATSGGVGAPPYGALVRLKSSVNIGGLKPAAQVVAKALKKYGMILSDGGNITFTATSDAFTTAKWAQVGLGPSDLKPLAWSDFEVVDGGTRVDWTAGSCAHVPVTN